MTLYCGIDLHSNNSYLCVINDNDERLLEKTFSNDIHCITGALKKYKHRLKAVAVESTFNWYWLVDGLMDAGFNVELVNTAKIIQYSGLKRTDDRYDAFHLAHLMRLGILPTGYIYPKAERGLRDLLRKRLQLVQDRTKHIVSFKTQYHRLTGQHLSTNHIKLKAFTCPVLGDANVQLALDSNLRLSQLLSQHIKRLEKTTLEQVKPCRTFELLKTTCGIGDILAQTILLETGDISRFKSPGHYASYCRCVDSRRMSNGKKKGEGNRKNGNRYLAWAYMEAANFAIRYNHKAKRRKRAKTNRIIALKALAHKIARACYMIILKQTPFDENILFS